MVGKHVWAGENCGVHPLRLVFAGSPDAAVPSLEALVTGPHEVVAVITREDSPQGRRGILTPTPVAQAALRHGIPTIKANRLRGAPAEQIAALRADLGVIVAYGGLLREPLLSEPTHGWINLHFSLLPRWRGAAPVQRALIAGDAITGSSVFRLVAELDAGDLFGVLPHAITEEHTAGSLLDELSHEGAGLLTSVVDAIATGTAHPEPQSGEVTLAPKLTLADGLIDFGMTAREVFNTVRGVTPEPGASTMLDGVRLKLIEVRLATDRLATDRLNTDRLDGGVSLQPGHFALVSGVLLVGTATEPIECVRVHPAGKKAMNAADWWRGRAPGSVAVVDDIPKEQP